MSSEPRFILFYDGECLLCNRSMRFMAEKDTGDNLRFAALQDDIAREMIGRFDDRAIDMTTVLYLEDGRVWSQSDAILRACRKLRPPHRWLSGFLIVPRPLRNWFYDLVARNRFRFFPKQDVCIPPSDAVRRKVLR